MFLAHLKNKNNKKLFQSIQKPFKWHVISLLNLNRTLIIKIWGAIWANVIINILLTWHNLPNIYKYILNS